MLVMTPDNERQIAAIVSHCLGVRKNRARVMFIGNGGSAAIAQHMAADWLKNGRFAAMHFGDGALTTCIGNDLGFEFVFSMPVARHGHRGDLLFAISSSGRSTDILSGVNAALSRGMDVVTVSGFKPDNPLSKLGTLANLYVASENYGVVEIAHLTLLHTILDRVMEYES